MPKKSIFKTRPFKESKRYTSSAGDRGAPLGSSKGEISKKIKPIPLNAYFQELKVATRQDSLTGNLLKGHFGERDKKIGSVVNASKRVKKLCPKIKLLGSLLVTLTAITLAAILPSYVRSAEQPPSTVCKQHEWFFGLTGDIWQF